MISAPNWLADFQQCFSAVLRTPLDAARGTLQSSLPPDWSRLGVASSSTRDAAAGVADYHRQYWFRLLNVMQTEFPLTSRLMGLWSFNLLAIRYLQEFPPRGHDLQAIRQNFYGYLRDDHQPLFLQQAARIDEARGALFMAPDHKPWRWEHANVADPGATTLHPAPDWALVAEDWALMDLCLQLPAIRENVTIPCPKPHEKTQTWLIQRDGKGLMHRGLPPAQARLYELLSRHSIEAAVTLLDQEFGSQGSADLTMAVQTWMAQSVTWGLWAVRDPVA